MRNTHRSHEVLLELRLDGSLDLLHAPHQIFDGGARAVVEQGDARAGASRIAGRGYLRQIAVRNHAEHHGVFDVDVTAEGAREPDAVHALLEPMRSISNWMPARSAALASWMARTSFCVICRATSP